jgi:hypothetical protein
LVDFVLDDGSETQTVEYCSVVVVFAIGLVFAAEIVVVPGLAFVVVTVSLRMVEVVEEWIGTPELVEVAFVADLEVDFVGLPFAVVEVAGNKFAGLVVAYFGVSGVLEVPQSWNAHLVLGS